MFLKIKFYQWVILLVWLSANSTQAATDCNAVTEIPVSECQSLLEFYNSTGGTKWKNKTGWNETNTPCSWYGVSCSVGVQSLRLNSNQLNGSIPNLNLPNLVHLSLESNQLSGSIPNLNLPNLVHLSLKSNQLSGSIPNLNLPNLEFLLLHFNRLTGSIPNLNLPKLKSLSLYSNQLSGSIPNFNLSKLTYLHLVSNCGLVAYDAAQEILLNKKDSNWKNSDANCPASNSTTTQTKTGSNVATVNGGDTSTMFLFFILACIVYSIYLLILGGTKKVVIYYDYYDLLKSFLPVLFCGMAIFTFKSNPFEMSFANWILHWIISPIIGIYGLIRTAITVNIAIQHNRDRDIAMGLIIGFFKIIFVSLAVFVAINGVLAYLNKILGKQTAKETAGSMILFFITGFITESIVNGEEVYLKKGWISPENN